MKVEDLFVPTDKCPLDFLAEMGERIKGAWILFDDTVVTNLKQSDGVIIKNHGFGGKELIWEATEDYPETMIIYDSFYGTGWYVLYEVEADDIAYTSVSSVREPNTIIRLKMAT